MKEPQKQNITYIGYEKPETEDELIVEILGLELAIETARQKIALLKQSIKIASMKNK